MFYIINNVIMHSENNIASLKYTMPLSVTGIKALVYIAHHLINVIQPVTQPLNNVLHSTLSL